LVCENTPEAIAAHNDELIPIRNGDLNLPAHNISLEHACVTPRSLNES
jgi:hypothetical protein